MDPERTQLSAPERIYLGYTSFWYETSEEGLHDIEYVRADLLATVRKEAFKEAVAAIEKLVCPAQFEGNWRNGYSHAQNDAYRAIEHLAALEAKKGEGNG